MRAVFYTGGKQLWADTLGDRPWALLPFGNRPLITYWFELCADLGITDVQMVLGRGAEHIEQFCGNGEKWGLSINYSFLGPQESPVQYFSRDPLRWQDGLFFMSDAVFPRRRSEFSVDRLKGLLSGSSYTADGQVVFLVSNQQEKVERFIQTGECTRAGCVPPESIGLEITPVQDVSLYYDLNMTLLRKEMDRYVSSGYSTAERAFIGFNVITPPSVSFQPPLAVGNDCRLGSICSIGPDAIISDHVLIDRQCELSECIILSDTYVGRNLEIKGKIVAGNRIIDPVDGSWLDIEDPWLVAHNRTDHFVRDFLRRVFGWIAAFLLLVIQTIPFLLVYSIIRMRRLGSFIEKPVWGIGGGRYVTSWFVATDVVPSLILVIFFGASLDRLPQLIGVVCGKLCLCGQVPKACGAGGFKEGHRYFPAVFSYSDAFAEVDKRMDALYYAHTRSLLADLRILRHALFARLVEVEAISGLADELG